MFSCSERFSVECSDNVYIREENMPNWSMSGSGGLTLYTAMITDEAPANITLVGLG
jgi:hypothetical protein